MKKILPLLLCYVLSASQMYAVSGGPVFTSNISPVGTFSGVIEGITETDDLNASGPPIPGDPLPAVNNSSTTPSNALGLFDLVVPSVGLSSGTFLLFADGIVFTGTITASADPDTDKIIGILEATTNIMVTDLDTGVSATVTESSVGEINATVTGATSTGSSLGALKGTADLQVSFGEVDPTTLEPIVDRTINFIVLGVKQSALSTATSSTGTATTAAPTSSGG
jgi:hypothetical protein